MRRLRRVSSAGPAHLPSVVTLSAEIVAAIVRHAACERDAPVAAESCGLVIGTASARDRGDALRYVETANAIRQRDSAAAATRFEIEPVELLRISATADQHGEAIWGIVHSHLTSTAAPSPLDTAGAHHPDAVHLIVSLDPACAGVGGEPELRGWWLRGGTPTEVRLAQVAYAAHRG